MPVFGISVVRKSENSFCFASVLSGQREFVTAMSRSIAVPASRSVSTRPVNQMTPKTGVVLPFGNQRHRRPAVEDVVLELLGLRLVDREDALLGVHLPRPGLVGCTGIGERQGQEQADRGQRDAE